MVAINTQKPFLITSSMIERRYQMLVAEHQRCAQSWAESNRWCWIFRLCAIFHLSAAIVHIALAVTR